LVLSGKESFFAGVLLGYAPAKLFGGSGGRSGPSLPPALRR
jgi:hypothetical protein